MQKNRLTAYGLVLILAGIIIGLVLSLGFNLTNHTVAGSVPPAVENPAPESPAPVPQEDNDKSPLLALSNAFADVAENVNPSVVTISTKKVIKGGQMGPFEDFFGGDEFFRRFFGAPIPHGDYVQQGLGSGVIVREDGIILTNNHVVKGADDIFVRLIDGNEYKAEVKGTDSRTDLAVLKIKADHLKVLKIGDSDALRVGEWVLAIGSPLQPELAHTVTAGIVSAKGRSGLGLSAYQDYIQTDAAINPGNSGGPLVNLKGELVGINTAIASRTGGNIGIGFAIPSNLARKVMNDILEKGRVVRGWLGIGIQTMTPELAKNFNLEHPEGVIVTEVRDDGPAKKAGLQVEDIIIALNGRKIKNAVQLSTKIGSSSPGTVVELTVLRDGKEKNIKVELAEMPAEMEIAQVQQKSVEELGFKVSNLTPALKRKYGIDDKKGVVVTGVEQGSVGFAAGLREGDLLLKVNRKEISSTSDFYKVIDKLEPGDSIALYIKRGDQ
ncbi:MAG: DegQ family serine endoprotease, partial [Calditrichia bacterium]